jgi:hypothetical protein
MRNIRYIGGINGILRNLPTKTNHGTVVGYSVVNYNRKNNDYDNIEIVVKHHQYYRDGSVEPKTITKTIPIYDLKLE